MQSIIFKKFFEYFSRLSVKNILGFLRFFLLFLVDVLSDDFRIYDDAWQFLFVIEFFRFSK